jgi:hypothetical protein
MRIAFIPLTSVVSVNSFRAAEAQSFIPGENLTLNFQLRNVEEDIRFIPLDPAAIITLKFITSDESAAIPNVLTKTATSITAFDLSLIAVSFTQLETEVLLGGVIELTIDELGDGSSIKKAVLRGALIREVISGEGCC